MNKVHLKKQLSKMKENYQVLLCVQCHTETNKSIESFEDVAPAIKNVESNFTIEYYDYDANMFPAPAPMVENYNKTLNSVWYFVPKISITSPSLTTICLIWTPSKDRRLERQVKALFSNYCKVASSRLSWLAALPMKGKLMLMYCDLWPKSSKIE